MKKITNIIVCAVLTVIAVIFPLTDKNISTGSGGGETLEITTLNELVEFMHDMENFTFVSSYMTSSNGSTMLGSFKSETSSSNEIYANKDYIYYHIKSISNESFNSINSITEDNPNYTKQVEMDIDMYLDNTDESGIKVYVKFNEYRGINGDTVINLSKISNKWIDFSLDSVYCEGFYSSISKDFTLITKIKSLLLQSEKQEDGYLNKSGNTYTSKDEFIIDLYYNFQNVYSLASLEPLEEGEEKYDKLSGSLKIDLGDKKKPKFSTVFSYSDSVDSVSLGLNSTASFCYGNYEFSNINNTKIKFPSSAKIYDIEIFEEIIGGNEDE